MALTKNSFKLVLLSAALLSLLASPALAVDKRCKTSADHIAKLIQIVKSVCSLTQETRDACAGKAQSAADAKKHAEKFLEVWNRIAGNSWARVGPRNFNLGKGDKGTIVSPGQRAWISRDVAKSTTSITVRELDGKLDANFNVCVIDNKGKVSYVKSTTFSKNAKKEKRTVTITGHRGKHVMFKLATARPSLGKKLVYTFSSSNR
jgi:hypothetical protein